LRVKEDKLRRPKSYEPAKGEAVERERKRRRSVKESSSTKQDSRKKNGVYSLSLVTKGKKKKKGYSQERRGRKKNGVR